MHETINGGDDVPIERVRADMEASVARARGLVARSRGLFTDPLAARSMLDVGEVLIAEKVDGTPERQDQAGCPPPPVAPKIWPVE
jgi:hypothetical protein